MTQKTHWLIDVAGAATGGSARYYRELRAYLDEHQRHDQISVIGEGSRLTPQWLLKREIAGRDAANRISLNNASFWHGPERNKTLLGNILHFAGPSDFNPLGFKPTTELKMQIPLIRQLAKRSANLIAPSSRMAEQVASSCPALADRIQVRFHPIATPEWAGTEPVRRSEVLMPIIPQPYKNLGLHALQFLEETEKSPEVQLTIPSCSDQIPELEGHPRVKFIGHQTSEELEIWWQECQAVFFPPEFEAFGYPLAEARVYGRSVIAHDNSQQRELAGNALHGYNKDRKGSLGRAVSDALQDSPNPDGKPFNPTDYFDWMLVPI
ncbi:glycosyltransferase [Glutamicibacter arilaitensis]|uniref:glycosyltransferase n=1 Tax=Glutamicibacter arilaitensis TaxID=256701 RepID=UPI00384E98E4